MDIDLYLSLPNLLSLTLEFECEEIRFTPEVLYNTSIRKIKQGKLKNILKLSDLAKQNPLEILNFS